MRYVRACAPTNCLSPARAHRSALLAVLPCLQVCLVGQDGTAVLRRLDPIFDPAAIEREVASICAQVRPLRP